MNVINNSWVVNQKKIVIFGAGKIGRSFIGQLFGTNGYEVVFVDIDPGMVRLLNQRNEYRVVIKSEADTEMIVKNVSAISGTDTEKVSESVATAGILAVSVGKNALAKVVPVIAKGLMMRYEKSANAPLDIILAENMLDAAGFVKEKLEENLPHGYPVSQLVGLVETSIGKMVPIIPVAEIEKDPLVVFAEPYNTLIVDKKGFKAPIPEVKGLAPKENIKAWVDRKAFIHNLGHATAAYYGYYRHPEATYMFEVLNDPEVFRLTRETMMQSAAVLQFVYPNDFSSDDLTAHVDDLLSRFQNKALKDTVFRVGQDLARKLGPDDRFMGAVRMAQKAGKPYNLIIQAMAYGFCFKATDEHGDRPPQDILFSMQIEKGLDAVLAGICGLDTFDDRELIKNLTTNFSELI